MSQNDFDFGFGGNRYFRGSGWKGLLALLIVVVALVIVANGNGPATAQSISRASGWISDQALRFFQGAPFSQSPAMMGP